MIIQKIRQVGQLFANVLNSKSDSKEDTYSADYINHLVENLDIDSIKTLESPVRIWGLEDNLYKLPSNCSVYYYGETSTTALSINSTSYLFVMTYNDYKIFYILGGTTSRYIYSGYSNSSQGGYYTFNIGQNYLTSNSIKNALNYSTDDSNYILSAYQGYVLDQKKVDKEDGKGLSTNDFTDEYKEKVDDIPLEHLPVGSEIAYDGEDVPEGWEEVENIDGIRELESPVRIWDLDTGVYKLPQSCTIYYYGETSTSSFSITGSSVLNVTKFSTTYKGFFILFNSSTTRYMYHGYSTSSSGSYSSLTLNNVLTGISGYVQNNLTYSTSNSTYALSAYQGKVLNDKISNSVVDSLSGSDTDKAPSINAVNSVLSSLEDKTVQTVTDSTIRIWDLEDGLYKLPQGCTVYYYGSSNTSSYFTVSSTAYLFVTHYSTTYKNFYIFTSSTATARYIYSGYSTSSSGNYNSLNLGSSYLTSISSYVQNNLTYGTSSTTYALSAYQGKVLDDKITALKSSLTKATAQIQRPYGADGSGQFAKTYTADTNLFTLTITPKLTGTVLVNFSAPIYSGASGTAFLCLMVNGNMVKNYALRNDFKERCAQSYVITGLSLNTAHTITLQGRPNNAGSFIMYDYSGFSFTAVEV